MDRFGVLLVDKPKGMTSHDVVDRFRKLLGMRSVGHAGTLDPDATGLLVLCLGAATKVSSLLTEGDKVYQAAFRLGLETTTYDLSGEVVAERAVRVERAEVERAATGLIGTYDQAPPIYSAVKVEGKRLYEYARRKESVNVPLRKVTVHALRILSFESPEGELEVRCSKGTYVRSLIHDLGERLGTGATTVSIRRLGSGSFHVEEAAPLDAFERAEDPERFVRERILSIPRALEGMPQLRVVEADHKARVLQGNGLKPADTKSCVWVSSPPEREEDTVLVINGNGLALALGTVSASAGLKVHRVL